MTGPYGRYPNNYPYWFIELEPTDPQFEQEVARPAVRSPEHTRDFAMSRLRSVGTRSYGGSLGNAIDFFMRRATEIDADRGGDGQLFLPDWNLDGDRGYAAQCWRLTVPPATPPNDLAPPNGSGVEIVYL